MKEFLSSGHIHFEKVKGVGTIDLALSPNQRVYTFIGENGIGKTKLLESLFTTFLLGNTAVADVIYVNKITNETQIAHVPGIVLIDEIESHLHNKWQVNIIPLLKQLFPNTVFFITTHSSLVISQLQE